MSWRRYFGRKRRDEDLAREIESYVRHEADDNVARGMTVDEARQAARRKFGKTTNVREAIYEMNSLNLVESVGHDIKHGLRQLRLNPGFALAAILSLALGIGANTAIFQLLNAVRVRPLPISKPEELVEIRVNGDGRAGRHTGRNRQVSNPVWQQLNHQQWAFSGMFAFGDTRFNLAPQGEVRYVEGLWVSGSFFPVLGVRPLLGRVFTPEDDRPGCGYFGVVISHSLWQREYGGRSDVLGQRLSVGPEQVPVIGVTPPEFFGVEVGRRFDVALPICSARLDRRDHFWLAVMGRLKPGWSVDQANAHLKSLGASILAETVPTNYQPDGIKKYLALEFEMRTAASGVSPMRTTYESSLWALLAIVGVVLLIASANLASLMLARAAARKQDFALRFSLGASRCRVVRQVLVESLLLAVLGAFSGLVVASWASGFLVAMVSTALDPIHLDLSMDWRLLGFTSAIAALACVLFGTAPAMQAAQAARELRAARGVTGTRERLTFRRALVVVQIALSFALLFGALLFTGSFRNLVRIETGFEKEGILIANLFFRDVDLPPGRREPLYRELTGQLRTIPGVSGVAHAFAPPLSGSFWDTRILIGAQDAGDSNMNQVSPGYFRVMGTQLLAGRDFGDQDTLRSPKVAIVTEAFARRFWNGAHPVGKTFATPGGSGQADTVYQVIGLVKDSKYSSMREEFPPIAFVSSSQEMNPGLIRRYVLRSSGPASALMVSVRQVVATASPGTSIRFAVLTTQIEETLLRERLMATLSGFFGVLAAVLAVVGLYGVVSYLVARRRNEIGIRMALGANRNAILRMILGEVGVLLVCGLAAGLVLALATGTAARTLLFGLEPHDPLVLLSATALLALVGLAAGFIPARRAAGIAPMTALREQ